MARWGRRSELFTAVNIVAAAALAVTVGRHRATLSPPRAKVTAVETVKDETDRRG